MSVLRGHAGGASSLPELRFADKDDMAVPVGMLSEIVSHSMDRARLVKIDVEGFEPLVLAGATDYFDRLLPESVLWSCTTPILSTIPRCDSSSTALPGLRHTPRYVLSTARSGATTTWPCTRTLRSNQSCTRTSTAHERHAPHFVHICVAVLSCAGGVDAIRLLSVGPTVLS